MIRAANLEEMQRDVLLEAILQNLAAHDEVPIEPIDIFINWLEEHLPTMDGAPFPRGNTGYRHGNVITIPFESCAVNLEVVLPEHALQHIQVRLSRFDLALMFEVSQTGAFQYGTLRIDPENEEVDICLDTRGRIMNTKWAGVPYLCSAIRSVLQMD